MTGMREALVSLAERAFRRQPPFDVIDELGIPSRLESALLHYEETTAVQVTSLSHDLYLASLRGETDLAVFQKIEDRLDGVRKSGRRKDRVTPTFRLDADRKGGLRVLRRAKRELMASGWKRLKGGRFQKDFETFWIQLWFDPGTYVDDLSIFLAAGPPRISLNPEKFFDILTNKLLFFGPPEEFEENLRKFLTVVARFEDGLKELLETTEAEADYPP